MQFDLLNVAIITSLFMGIIFAIGPLIASFFLAPRISGGSLSTPYECGVQPYGPARINFGINYYFYALLFLAFDVDVLYLFPIVANYSQVFGWTIFWELLIFIGILVLAIIYFWRKGVFTWPRRIIFY